MSSPSPIAALILNSEESTVSEETIGYLNLCCHLCPTRHWRMSNQPLSTSSWPPFTVPAMLHATVLGAHHQRRAARPSHGWTCVRRLTKGQRCCAKRRGGHVWRITRRHVRLATRWDRRCAAITWVVAACLQLRAGGVELKGRVPGDRVSCGGVSKKSRIAWSTVDGYLQIDTPPPRSIGCPFKSLDWSFHSVHRVGGLHRIHSQIKMLLDSF
jgi:hypothetical protein